MKKHGTNCDCGMCRVGKAMGMIKKPHSDQEHDHQHNHEHDHDYGNQETK